MQPIFRMNPFVTRHGNGQANTNAYIIGESLDIGMDIFNRGLCLPSDNKMTVEQQDYIIEVIKGCFKIIKKIYYWNNDSRSWSYCSGRL